MNNKLKIILLSFWLMWMPLFAICQSTGKEDALRKTASDFLQMYNTGDSAIYRNFLKQKVSAELLEDKLKRFGNTWNSIGAVEKKQINIPDQTHAEIIVQEKRYGSWWRFVIETDSNQNFINRTVVPVQMPEVGLKSGNLSSTQISERVTDYILNILKTDFSGNVYIKRGARAIYSKSFGNAPNGKKNDITSEFGLASSAKMFTGIAVLQLEEKEKISLSDKVSKIMPELKNPIYQNISIAQLLNHTSGLGDFFEDQSYQHGVTDMQDRATIYGFIERTVPLFESGQDFRYSNTGYLLLGLIIERISGKNFKSYVEENIFHMAGMHASKPGDGAGGGTSTVGDMVRFNDALRDNKFMGKVATEKFMTFHTGNNYGYGSEHHLLGKEHIFGHSGGYIDQCIEINFYKKTRSLVIILSNSNPPYGHFLSNKIKELMIRKS